MGAGWIRGHVLTPRPEGGLIWRPDAIVGWDDDGRLIAQQGTGGGGPLLVPGFVDVHVHLPQYRVRGRFHEKLLPWLRNHIWPEEERFAERSYREGVTREFRDGLIANGTTSAMVYGSPEADSTHAVLQDLAPLTIKGGDVLMDRNSPPALLRDRDESLQDAAAHAGDYGERYALTPRFAPTCSDELMAGCGALLASTDARLQTHLAENEDEIAWVAELHPEDRSYLAVYDRHGLLGPRSIFGHGVHLDDADLDRLAATGSWLAHCPTSNVALGSGRMPLERVARRGVRWALATDVGAGPDLSMLDVMHTFMEVHAEHADAGPGLALTAATWFGAQALGESRARGALVPGLQADVVALEIPGGLRRGEHGLDALGRVLAEFRGRYADAVQGVWCNGERLK